MCPTGWVVPTDQGPGYLDEVLGAVHVTGELKAGGARRGMGAAAGA